MSDSLRAQYLVGRLGHNPRKKVSYLAGFLMNVSKKEWRSILKKNHKTSENRKLKINEMILAVLQISLRI